MERTAQEVSAPLMNGGPKEPGDDSFSSGDPERGGTVLADAREALRECTQACTTCAGACLAEDMVAELRACGAASWVATTALALGAAAGVGVAAALPAAADAPAASEQAARFEVDFLTGMIDHHHMAVMMAEMCVEQVVHPDLESTCESIVAAQSAEIEMMQGWLQDWYGITYEPDMTGMQSMHRFHDLAGRSSRSRSCGR